MGVSQQLGNIIYFVFSSGLLVIQPFIRILAAQPTRGLLVLRPSIHILTDSLEQYFSLISSRELGGAGWTSGLGSLKSE